MKIFLIILFLLKISSRVSCSGGMETGSYVYGSYGEIFAFINAEQKIFIEFLCMFYVYSWIIKLVSPDNKYNKTYYIGTNFMTGWMGSYSWCKANNMEMLTFDCQDEHDKFLNNIAANRSSYSFLIVSNAFVGLFLGAYQNHVKANSPNSFVWYESGASVYPTVNFKFLPGQPDTYGNAEWCIAIESFSQGSCGVNDYLCNDLNLRFFPACQLVTFKAKGMNPKQT